MPEKVANLNFKRKYGIFSKAPLHCVSYVLLIVSPSQKKERIRLGKK